MKQKKIRFISFFLRKTIKIKYTPCGNIFGQKIFAFLKPVGAASHAEIADAHGAIFVDEDVTRLEVAMEAVGTVNVKETTEHLVNLFVFLFSFGRRKVIFPTLPCIERGHQRVAAFL